MWGTLTHIDNIHFRRGAWSETFFWYLGTPCPGCLKARRPAGISHLSTLICWYIIHLFWYVLSTLTIFHLDPIGQSLCGIKFTSYNAGTHTERWRSVTSVRSVERSSKTLTTVSFQSALLYLWHSYISCDLSLTWICNSWDQTFGC